MYYRLNLANIANMPQIIQRSIVKIGTNIRIATYGEFEFEFNTGQTD